MQQTVSSVRGRELLLSILENETTFNRSHSLHSLNNSFLIQEVGEE